MADRLSHGRQNGVAILYAGSGVRRSSERSDAARRSAYIRGNVLEDMMPESQEERVPSVRIQNTVRKNREKAVYMNFSYMAFLTAELVFAAITLCSYIQIQSQVTNQVKQISSMEAQYNDLKISNDEEYNRINSSIDLEKIKAVAIGELGMTYAEKGQIVQIQGSDRDYVHQVEDLPDQNK